MKDAIHDRIAQIDVARRHINFGAQNPLAFLEFSGPHIPEERQVLINRTITMGTVLARLSQSPAIGTDLVCAQVVHIGLAVRDQVLGPFIELFKIVGGKILMLTPVEAEPAHVFLNGVNIFLLFLGRVGIVETQIAAAGKLFCQAEIQAD